MSYKNKTAAEYLKEYRARPGVAHKQNRLLSSRFHRSKHNAKRRNLGWTIPRPVFDELASSPCFYCDSFYFGTGSGLDRVDNSKGYTEDNVLPCCPRCNVMRNQNLTIEETRYIAQKLIEFRQSEKGIIPDRRTLFSDVDDTLLIHDLSKYPPSEHITITCGDRVFTGVPHKKNIGLLVKFFRLGYDVYVWSLTGKKWARAVVKALNLEPYIVDCLCKPDFYADDKEVSEWMGPRIYREP